MLFAYTVPSQLLAAAPKLSMNPIDRSDIDNAAGTIQLTQRRRWTLTRCLDQGAIGLSLLCLVHCLALPVVVMALPAVAEVLPRQWWVHPVIFAFAVPMAAIALVRGWYDHRNRCPLMLGGTGLAILGLGLAAREASVIEVGLTIVGGVFIAIAHLLNWRFGAHGHRRP